MGNSATIMARALIEGAKDVAETPAGRSALTTAGKLLDEALMSGALRTNIKGLANRIPGNFESLLGNSPSKEVLTSTGRYIDEAHNASGLASQLGRYDKIAPSNIDRIIPNGMPEITAGRTGSLFPDYAGAPRLTARITTEGQAFVTSHQPGFVLRGGGWLHEAGSFEKNRQLVPLPVGKEVLLGTWGDTIFKPASSNIPAIELQDVGSSLGGNSGLLVKKSDFSVQDLIRNSIKSREAILNPSSEIPAKILMPQLKPGSWKF